MTSGQPHITVCICTFRRPFLLEKLLRALETQKTDGHFTLSIVVSDNDKEESARVLVESLAATSSLEIIYCSESRQNIALARNRALEQAKGEYIAFIDDDEFPDPDWLQNMLKTCDQYQAAGVLGPVRPYFAQPPPKWIITGGFCERPEPPSGRVMHWEESRTGNLLFRRDILEGMDLPFKPEFGTGGEDKDFFMRMAAKGLVFRWCNEGVAHELVPPARWRRIFMLRRALLRGKNILKHPSGRAKLLATSFAAAPIYLIALPFTLVRGQHVFMKYCIKFCDHFGRILAFFRLNFVNER